MPRIMVDLTNSLASKLKTGIQGVAKNMISALALDKYTFVKFKNHKFEFVQEKELQNLFPMVNLPKTPYRSEHTDIFSPGDVLLVLDLHLDKKYLAEIRNLILSKVDVRFYVHDVLPLTHKHFFPSSFSNDFLEYVKVVGETRSFAASTRHTKTEIEFVTRKFPISKSTRNPVIPIGVNIVKELEAKCCSSVALNDDYFLCVSNFEPRKNHQLLLNAFAKVYVELGIQCVLVGGNAWMSDSIWQAVDSINSQYGKIVHLFRDLNPCCLAKLYGHARFTVYLSLAEGYGMPILESLYFDKQVLVSDRPPMNELVDSALIYKVDPTDVSQISAKLLEMNHLPLGKPIQSQIPKWSDSARELEKWLMNG